MKLLNSEEQIVEKIDFGIVDVGTSKSVQYTLQNDDDTYIDNIKIELEEKSEKKEISISTYQSSLGKNGTAAFNVTWTPTLVVKRGLKLSFVIKYRKVYGV